MSGRKNEKEKERGRKMALKIMGKKYYGAQKAK